MSLKQFALAMLVLTGVPAAAGAFFGVRAVSIVRKAQAAKKHDPPPAARAYLGTLTVKELPSIVTNLARPKHAMIRLQAAILFKAKAVANPDVLANQIAGDTMAFLSTVTASQIEGASGLAHLRDDLNDRARIRSQGRVREMIIETLVVQ